MTLKDHISPDFLHHAYCLVGDREEVKKALLSFIEEKLDFKTQGNPDFWLGEFDTFLIEDGRSLKERQINKSFGGGKSIFVLAANSLPKETQNALLKVFEEPSPETHFFLILPSLMHLLPTLKSRLHIIRLDDSSEKDEKGEAIQFLQSSKPDRLKLVSGLLEEKDKEKTKSFLDEVEAHVYRSAGKKGMQNVRSLEEIIKMKQYLEDRGSSAKMILEHLALFLD